MMSSMFISVGYFQCLINYQHIRYESNLVNFEILEGLNIDLGSSQPPSFIFIKYLEFFLAKNVLFKDFSKNIGSLHKHTSFPRHTGIDIS